VTEASASSSPSRRTSKKASAGLGRTADQAAVEREWEDIPSLPGIHLSWRKVGWGTWELITGGGEVWGNRTYRYFKLDSMTVGDRTFAVRPMQPPEQGTHQWIDGLGKAVCVVKGDHFERIAGTVMQFDGLGTISFPVRGRWNRAVMSAVDEAGVTLVRYRLNPTNHKIPVVNPFGCNLRRVEAVVNPNIQGTPEIALLVAASCPWLLRYFEHGGSGGA